MLPPVACSQSEAVPTRPAELIQDDSSLSQQSQQ